MIQKASRKGEPMSEQREWDVGGSEDRGQAMASKSVTPGVLRLRQIDIAGTIHVVYADLRKLRDACNEALGESDRPKGAPIGAAIGTEIGKLRRRAWSMAEEAASKEPPPIVDSNGKRAEVGQRVRDPRKRREGVIDSVENHCFATLDDGGGTWEISRGYFAGCTILPEKAKDR